MVATIRAGEAGAGNDLVPPSRLAERSSSIDVGPLDRSQSEEVLRECLAVEIVPADLLEAVVLRSDGIPFFIEELLASALADPSGGAVPSSIGTSLEDRLASLPDDTAQLVRYTAVLGRQFDWHVVAAALRCPPEDAIRGLREAIRAQLIDTVGGAYRFRHALTVEAVQRSLLLEERQLISAELSRTLKTLHPGLEGELCQLAANLAEGGGEVVRAAELWLDAARRALGEGSLTSAEALALRARPQRPVEADRLLLSTWALAGQPLRALEVGERILASSADPAIQTEVRFDLVDAMIDAGRWEDAKRHLAEPGRPIRPVPRHALGDRRVRGGPSRQ